MNPVQPRRERKDFVATAALGRGRSATSVTGVSNRSSENFIRKGNRRLGIISWEQSEAGVESIVSFILVRYVQPPITCLDISEVELLGKPRQ
jgi:hypothetical protein